MILRKFPLLKALVLTLHLLTVVSTQDAKSYEENDWIPITPSTPSEKTKKAEPRVLNINAPAQNYFPQNDYVGKRAQPQYVQEISFPKEPVRQAKPAPYKFEPVLPLQPPQYLQQGQFAQQPQFVQSVQLPYVQTLQQVQQIQPVQRPAQEQALSQQLMAPLQSTQNYYDTTKTQYTNLVNSSYFPTASVVPLNQELLGALQNLKIKDNSNGLPLTTSTVKPQEDKQSVQLLYVPLESLQNQAATPQTPRLVKQTEAPRREKQLPVSQTHRINQLTGIQGDFIQQALAAHKLHQQFKLGEPVLLDTITTTTTPKPKKRQPNQPPLAVYMEKEGAADVKDVLQVLKHVKTIPVQDSVGPGSPKVFVGPYNIDPEGYVKYPLPYLSSVQGNRIERKVEDLPFFVAPLSYKTPDGYSKIPLPSPHVGSVVVSTKQLHEKDQEHRQPQTAQNQIVPDFDVKQPFRDSNKPNTYLVRQNNLQPSQSSLLQFANPFYPNVPQNYDVSSSKEFGDEYQDSRGGNTSEQDSYEDNLSRDVPNYQLGLRDTNQYYETTPNYKNQYFETTTSYKPTERNNIRGSYQVSDYQNTDRELPDQNSKELIRDYDIPSVPVESKTSYTPNYQLEQKPQINQFVQSLETPKTPADVYNLNEEPIRQTTTTTEPTRVTSQNRFKSIPNPDPEYTRDVPQNPYRQQVINQYEIEQINSQLREYSTENVEPVRSTTPAVVPTRKYVDYNVPTTPARGRSRGRHRGRTTTTTTTTLSPLSEEAYTVLEEFNIQPKTSTVKYTTEVETIPAKVYKLEEQQPQQAPVYQKETRQKQQNLKQEILDQKILQAPTKQPVEQQFLHETTPTRQNLDYSQEDYSVPSGENTNFDQLPSRPSPNYGQELPSRPTADYGQELPSRPALDFNQQLSSRPTVDYNPQLSTKLTSDFNQQIPSRPTVDYNQQISSRPTVDYTEQVASRPSADYNQQVSSRPSVDYNQQVSSRPAADYKQQLLQNHAPARVQSETERSIADVQEPLPTPEIYNRAQDTKEQGQGPNPYLPGLINNLQDQAIRPLLSPNLLVPTTEKLTTLIQPTTEEIRVVTTTTEAPRVETTTQRRNRGRQRGHTRVSSTSPPRRPVNRRRPSYTRPTTTERQYVKSTSEAPAEYEPTKRIQTQRQRFRTRGRPLNREQATERISQTTENVFKQPEFVGGFQASSGDPQSYMQFDHVVDNQQVITIRPQIVNEEATMKGYHQVYSLPAQNPSTERIVEDVISTTRPVVDVKITHPVSPVTERIQEPVIITTPSDDSRFIRVNSNLQTGTTLHHRHNEVTARAPVRQRARSRTRSRLSSTTPRPVTTTRVTTTPQPQPQQQEEQDDEFYGFIRKPNFQNPQPVVLTTTQPSLPLYSASYKQTPRTIIQLEEDNLSSGQNQEYESIVSPAPVQFVGQIRPKYTTTEAPETPTTQKVRIRGRIRVPTRKVTAQPQQSYNEVRPQKVEDPVTRRNGVVRVRGRGKAHFKVPETASVKNNDDDDVEGGNYPGNFLKNKLLTTERPSAFQITVDPSDDLDDQEPHSSLYSPQVLRNAETQWVEASVLPEENHLEIEDKLFESSSEEQTTVPFDEAEAETESVDEDIATTTETIETTTQRRRKGGKRRGVWKLVKQRPVDSIETAESQNYFSVLNAFDEIEKKQKEEEAGTVTTTPSTTTTTTDGSKNKTVTSTTTEASIFDTLYNMLGFASKTSKIPPGRVPQLKLKTKMRVAVQKEEVTTTTASPTFPEEYTEEATTQEMSQTEEENEETTVVPTTTTTSTTTTTTTEASVKNYEVEPWKTHEVKTSTSTEVSHMTEICYKGKCIIKRKLKTRL